MTNVIHLENWHFKYGWDYEPDSYEVISMVRARLYLARELSSMVWNGSYGNFCKVFGNSVVFGWVHCGGWIVDNEYIFRTAEEALEALEATGLSGYEIA